MPGHSRRVTAVVWLVCAALTLVFPACRHSALVVVYRNDFNGPIGETFSEWISSPVTFTKTVTG
jgi:hypothetical protein